jgi:arsenite/tail-anchored protein-transporting ATPase
MWRNVAGHAASSPSVDRDLVLAALQERQERFERTRLVLRDPARTAFVFVTVAERLPVLETHRIVGVLSRHGIPIGGLIVNQILPDRCSDPFLLRRKEREAKILTDIRERFRNWPVAYLPLLEQDPVATDDLTDLLGRLRAEPAEATA